MLIIPSYLVAHKRKLEKNSCLAQLFFLILCFLVHSNKAGVIKKRDTAATVTQNGKIEFNIKETEVEPTILTASNNGSDTFFTKLLSVATSKELTNNEILINEAKKLLEKEDEIKRLNNATEEEISKNKLVKSKNIIQDFDQIIETLEKKEHRLNGTHQTTTEFSSNDIKEDKLQKLKERQNENSTSMENPLSTKPSSQILTDMVTEKPAYIQSKLLENSIENGKEQIKHSYKLDTKDKGVTSLEPMATAKPMTSNNEENILNIFETSTSAPEGSEILQVLKTNTTLTDSKSENFTKSIETLTKTDEISVHEHQSNQIHDVIELLNSLTPTTITITTTTNSLLNPDKTTLKPSITNYKASLRLEGSKQEYARSMFEEETTTTNFNEMDEPLTTTTPSKPVILSIKEGVAENMPTKLNDVSKDLKKNEWAPLSIKEKKPKFINDNSTNAQQLNLPNNAEVWSLASMKSLPMANITIETEQKPNQTNKELKQLHNNTLTLNNNSEKNLLDWTQIMMDKELSTTARNENRNREEDTIIEKEKQRETETDIEIESKHNDTKDLGIEIVPTTLMPVNEATQFKIQPDVDVTTKNSLIHQESSTSTFSPVPVSTILSDLNYNENNNKNKNQPDKKVEENISNRIDMLTTTLATTVATNVHSEPFNTTLNIEPNLNEINLTLNQTDIDLNMHKVHITNLTTDGKKTVDDDVNANARIHIEASTVAAITTTATSTTKATAVVDLTTVEQSSSETTTVSMAETTKQNAPFNSVVVVSEQEKHKNKINEETNFSLSASRNELENTVFDKLKNQFENIDLSTKITTTTTVNTIRPNILAITATTSIPITLKQEIDQNSNEIQANLTNTDQQSITKTYLHNNHQTKAIETEFETTTAATELTTSKLENTLTSSIKVDTTTSSPKDEIINETTEINFVLIETTTTQATLKQGDEETTTGSPVVSENEKFEKDSETTTEANIFSKTSTETPVVDGTEDGKAIIENITLTTKTTTTTAIAEQSIIATTTAKQENYTKKNILLKEDATIATIKTMNNTQETIATTTSTSTAHKEEDTYISLLDDTTTTTQSYSSTISTTPTSHIPDKATTTSLPPSSPSTLPSAITTKAEEIYTVINSTSTELIQTTTQQLLTEIVEESSTDPFPTSTSTYFTEMLPPAATTQTSQVLATANIGKTLPTLTSIMGGNSGNMYPKNSEPSAETDINVIIAITVSVIGVVALILLVGFLYLMRKRQKQTSYSQRCRPVSLDEYTIDNASVSGSMRKSSALRASKRTYGNLAFDDPALRPNPLGVQELTKFAQEKLRIFEEFRDVPQITSRLDEVPTGCEDKNRYANVLPLPETRVILQRLNDDEKSEYINANYVTGPKDPPNYYIACQAPLESTVEDFWRMIWEQQSRVIIQATDLIENGVEKCAEYLPPSVTLDNHSNFGDFQITLQNREVKDKYAISTILLKHVGENATRELTHYWYKWPEVGVPTEEAPIIAMLLEARSSLISYAIEQANEDKEKLSTRTLKSAEEGTASANDSTSAPINNSNSNSEINGNISMVHIKKAARNQGPLTIHCSPGTGRTGTIIACDIALRSLETPKRTVDIPQIVYYVRRGRASAVLTKEQYEFIYKVANMYAAKITNPTNYN